jgi:hypothetical protein
LAEGLINNPLAAEVAKINEKKNRIKKVDPTILLKKNKDREQCKISERTSIPIKYQRGDLVLVKWEAPSTGQSRKLEPKYKGPYQIKRELRYDRYVVGDIEGEQLDRKPFNSVSIV